MSETAAAPPAATGTNNSQLLDQRYRTTAMVVGAEIFISLALVVVAWFVISYSYNDISDQALYAIWLTILFVAAGSFILRRAMFSWERLKNATLLKGVSGLFDTLQANTILLGMLGVVIAILGFLAAALSGNKVEMLRAGAISLIVFLMIFPRKSIWRKILAAAEKL
jgi:hypothetical protein